jgi:hypothetical protein
MSLSIPRPAEMERASVMLPTVTCSSCSAPIPFSSLGDHVCLPPGRATGSRAVPRPSQLSIPTSRPATRSPLANDSSRFGGPSGPSSSSSSSRPGRPFAGPSSVSSGSPFASTSNSAARSRPSPSALDIPPRDSSSRTPSPLSGSADGAQYLTRPAPSQTNQRVPSPTNPFFPPRDQEDGVVVHGLGLGVGASSRREGPYPTDRPLPAGMNGPGLTDDAAGMAGVGRRAFAAAAWGVRAGVAMAHAGAQRISPVEQVFPKPTPTASSPLEPPSRQPESRPRSPYEHQQQQQVSMPVPQVTGESHLPRAPLSKRPSNSRNPSISNMNLPERSASAMSHRSANGAAPPQSYANTNTSTDHRRQESVSSNGSRQSGRDDSISQLLKARVGEPASEKKPAFFEKYKQFTEGRNSPSPILGLDRNGLQKMVSSPEHASLRIEDEEDDEDDGESALPWAKATPKTTPSIRPPIAPRSYSHPHAQTHSRQPTVDSSSGRSSSSSRSGGNGGTSGPECEDLVTPSQSWEGSLVDRAGPSSLAAKKDNEQLERDRHGDALEQIGEEEEEDEGDRVVFSTHNQHRPSRSTSSTQRTDFDFHHNQASTTTTKPYPHVRSHTDPIRPKPSGGGSGSKRTKQCQNCLEVVGGSKRFVERDGVVLCEKDWKKLYLPSCRRCHLPIEKSAVSSSDGQLKGKWHKGCFSCTKCSKPFEGDSFYVLAGKPWCQYHYHEEK